MRSLSLSLSDDELSTGSSEGAGGGTTSGWLSAAIPIVRHRIGKGGTVVSLRSGHSYVKKTLELGQRGLLQADKLAFVAFLFFGRTTKRSERVECVTCFSRSVVVS